MQQQAPQSYRRLSISSSSAREKHAIAASSSRWSEAATRSRALGGGMPVTYHLTVAYCENSTVVRYCPPAPYACCRFLAGREREALTAGGRAA